MFIQRTAANGAARWSCHRPFVPNGKQKSLSGLPARNPTLTASLRRARATSMRARLSRQVRQRVCARRGGGAGDALDREEEVLRLPGAVCKTCSLPRGVLDCPIGSLTTRNEGLYRGQNAQRQLHRARRGLRYGALADKQLIGLGRIVRGECPLIGRERALECSCLPNFKNLSRKAALYPTFPK